MSDIAERAAKMLERVASIFEKSFGSDEKARQEIEVIQTLAIDLRAEMVRLEKQNEQFIAKLHCMCGSPVDHSAWEGHTAVSMYDHELDQAREKITELEAEADRWMGRALSAIGKLPADMRCGDLQEAYDAHQSEIARLKRELEKLRDAKEMSGG